MKTKIAILGSTGSIGKTLLEIIKKDKKNFEIVLLTADKNYKKLLNQAKFFNVKNLIITDQSSFQKVKKIKNLDKINIYNNFLSFKKIFKKKVDYVMSSITGIDGLNPTIKIINFTKSIAIANKEALICGWNLINKQLIKNNVNFFPVDSEHFSISYALNNNDIKNIEKLFITASGGPLLKTPINQFKNLKIKKVLKHPNWKMGKKITIDSATMMNKVFEVIEARNIFGLDYKRISILIHPASYVHTIIKLKDGMIKIIAHDTTMKIPIFNTLYPNNTKSLVSKDINIKSLNNLDLQNADLIRYPHIKILKNMPTYNSLYETVIVSINDELVKLYLENKINFPDISKYFFKLINLREFQKYKKHKVSKIKKILELNKYVRFKIRSKHI
jgi:1-deoxy-D-xylulose-5-phosphate reductoisomerase